MTTKKQQAISQAERAASKLPERAKNANQRHTTSEGPWI